MSVLREQCRKALWPGNPPAAPDRQTQDAMLDRLIATLDSTPAFFVSMSHSHFEPTMPRGTDPFGVLGEH